LIHHLPQKIDDYGSSQDPCVSKGNPLRENGVACFQIKHKSV